MDARKQAIAGVLGLSLTLHLAGCQDMNGLAAVNQALGTINATLGARPTGGYASQSAGTMVYVPEETRQRTSGAMTAAQAQEINRMIADARPAIENVVALAACGADRNRMNRYIDPDSSFSYYMKPADSMRYHKSGCLTPLRIAGWKRKSANALEFFADYVSPQSEESARQRYIAVRQPSGEWLFGFY
ncbi:hypothetical protein RA280_46155 [Cupriavidus sp. CV2]|uniref:hypothetical protein n=1 Tax=Cupriavidus ulmosensis TaxID=3065913 RepID=UPI00296B480D|nr:hypothetical protein [Cupriavidus sp. CV2]MDW3688980.1 hypothetical protein [Cupriavidus sp. CV2]